VALLAPLDWGLGHAARCIPLIEKLLETGFKVIVATGGDQKILISAAFPDLDFVNLNGYGMRYGRSGAATIVNILLKTPTLLAAVRREKRWLKDFLRDHKVDVVISDNRFGLSNKNVLCVFVTHQLFIKTKLGNCIDRWVQQLNYQFVNRFDRCWVPDEKNDFNLAGILSHPHIMPKIPVSYLGVLSRIQLSRSKSHHQLLILLSGPEPQRSIIEKKLLEQLENYTHPVIFVRGLPSAPEKIEAAANIQVYPYLAGKELEDVISGSEFIICRSGYSSLMDLLPLGKKCLLIPTPGQGEQGYLARLMAKRGWTCVQDQASFSLKAALQDLSSLQVPDLRGLKNSSSIDKAVLELKEMVQKNAVASRHPV
jgi:uncharacterized protein (TIGR00661 family)